MVSGVGALPFCPQEAKAKTAKTKSVVMRVS